MKSINIFAILLVVSIVNSTRKMPSFEDIVLSFTETQASPGLNSMASLNNIQEKFAESYKLLESMKSVITASCKSLEQSNSKNLADITSKIAKIKAEIEEIKASTKKTQALIAENIKNQAEENKVKEKASASIKKAAEETNKKTAELFETLQVLKRLRNFAQDELAGDFEKKTEMTGFKIVNDHKVSFIERENISKDLHELLKKSEVAGKPMITTLILIASERTGKYSNQGTIKKILDLLNKIIAQNSTKEKALQAELSEVINNYRAIKSNSDNLLAKLEEDAIRDSFTVNLNHKTITMYEADIIYFTKAQNRRQKRGVFQRELCEKHQTVIGSYEKQYASAKGRISELRTQFN